MEKIRLMIGMSGEERLLLNLNEEFEGGDNYI